ncbi:class II aldolase/adducin family protein [Streptomyces polyrhachis]|uniref:Class II aldolase/adducin family protein n=1 Tax=Streptomyces polyrhachis TaxID=1282885 RepID=A0ABW2GG49_9ACTN
MEQLNSVDRQAAWTRLLEIARRTADEGLIVGTAGNVSVRVGDEILVTPSGIPYDRLGPGDLTAVSPDGRRTAGTLRPTSELPMHLALYAAAPEARAIVHTHAVHATAVSTLVRELPPIHYMTAALGGPVRVAPYARYGSQELAAGMREALRDRSACLLRNHGTMAYGASLDQAYERTALLEWLCRLWLTANSVPGMTPALLDPAEVAAVGEQLRGYGQR